MFLGYRGERPQVHESAYIAPNAVVCGNVTVGRANSAIRGLPFPTAINAMNVFKEVVAETGKD